MLRDFSFFIFGLLFNIVFIPIIEEVMQIILTLLEFIKGKIMVPITKINQQIQNINDDENASNKCNLIGFSVEADVEEGDNENEDV